MLDEIIEFLEDVFPEHKFKVGLKKETIGKTQSFKPTFKRQTIEIEIDERHEYAMIIKGMPEGNEDPTEEEIFNNLRSITEKHIEIIKKKDEKKKKEKEKNESKKS